MKTKYIGHHLNPILFLLYACHHSSGDVGTGGSQTFCETSTVVEGEAASVSCHFPHDVAAHRHTVNVLRYDFEGPSFVPELVLKCFWREGFDNPYCTTSEGFHFDGQLNNRVTVRIRNTTRRHAGIYRCDYSAAAPEDQRECRLHVKGTKISCTSVPVYEGDPTSVTCHFNSNLRETKDDFFVYRSFKTRGKNQTEDVLTCNWVRLGKERCICFPRDGYLLNNNDISNEVTIHIPSADQNLAGRYYCDTVPSQHAVVSVEHCDVDVRVKTATSLVRKTSTTARPLTDRQPNTTTTGADHQPTSDGIPSDVVRASADPLLLTTLVVGTVFISWNIGGLNRRRAASSSLSDDLFARWVSW